MKIPIGVIAILIGLIIWGLQIKHAIFSDFEYERDYGNEWSLADKSSTIPAKQKHITEFVRLLEAGNSKGEFSSHNAIYLKTPNNSFSDNLASLKTLATRLDQISGMNPNSFEYNTAIQQITSQEQGEAHAMLKVFDGCWTLGKYPDIWGWIAGIYSMGGLVLVIIGVVLIESSDY